MSSNVERQQKTTTSAPARQDISAIAQPEEYIHTSLFHEVYVFSESDLKTDFKSFWGRTGIAEPKFDTCWQALKELSVSFAKGELSDLNHADTVDKVIIPLLEGLGWDVSANELVRSVNLTTPTKTGDEVSIRPSILAFKTAKDAKHFTATYKDEKKIDQSIQSIPISTSYYGAWNDIKTNRYDIQREQVVKFGDTFSSLGNLDQAFNYLDILDKEWAVATDGYTWRLIKKSEFQKDHSRYFEFSVGQFLHNLSTATPAQEDALIEVSKYFYWFFSKENLINTAPANIFVAFEKAQKYNRNLEDDLRARFVAAMSIAVNSLWSSAQEKNLDLELDYVQDIAESIIYNTLFIRSCESRRVLPLHQNYIPVSLHNLLGKLREFQATEEVFSEVSKLRLRTLFKSEVKEDGNDIFSYLVNLFDLTNDSEKKSRALGFAIEGFSENIFTEKEWATLRQVKIDNVSFAKILRTLFFMERDSQLPFNVLTPQQFGSIFESFLEFKLSKVGPVQYLVKRVRDEKIDILWDEKTKSTDEVLYIARRGSLYFRPDNLERKISGSFFTPDYIVDLIIRETLGPVVKPMKADEILKIKVCDPAMGSGHFLISALRFLTTEFLRRSSGHAESVTTAKRRILHSCVFGVDRSRRAVKLAKLALWLETSEAGKSLEHLDDQVKCANSLTDDSLWRKEWKFMDQGIDAVVGNPPYLAEKGQKDLFRQLASTTLGTKYYLGKMDLFYFFYHLGIEILKPKGRLGFITTSYWPTADAAKKLRSHIDEQCILDKMIFTGGLKIFKDAF